MAELLASRGRRAALSALVVAGVALGPQTAVAAPPDRGHEPAGRQAPADADESAARGDDDAAGSDGSLIDALPSISLTAGRKIG